MLLKQFPKYQRWTVGAVECYKRGCICKDCPTFTILGERCVMKNSVLQLVKLYGKPEKAIIEDENETTKESEDFEMAKQSIKYFDEDLNIEYSNYFQPLMEAVKKGYANYDVLEKMSGLNRKAILVYFDNFYKLLKEKTLIHDTDKSKRQAVVDWVQSRLCDKEYKQITQNKQETVKENKEPDYKAEFEKLKTENTKLKERITELENQPKTQVNFSEIKQRIQNQIEQLNSKLKAIELLEKDLLHQTM